MNSKVCMIEYQGRVDENGKALGHGPKVLNDYYNLIKDLCELEIFAPKEILKEFIGKKDSIELKVLPDNIVMGQDKTVFIKIKNKLNMFHNISLALNNTKADTVWFFNVEYYFFLYLFLHRRLKKKIICTMFLDGYRGGIVAKIKQFIFEKAQKKIDFIIATGKQLEFKNCEYKYVPDYYYENNNQFSEINFNKKEMAVCLGTMGKGKQLEEMVFAFNKSGYPLVIAGRFHDKNQLENLLKIKKDNIEVKDEYLSKEEYMMLLSSAKYTVLPYSPDKYEHQTSGVMQEAIFVNTIPVSFDAVLNGNDVLGIGFEKWDDLDLSNVADEKLKECYADYEDKRNGEYNLENVKAFYNKLFNYS